MKRIGVIANPRRPHAADIFDRLNRKATELNWTLFADANTSQYLPGVTVIDFEAFPTSIDVLLAMGGDGTVLFCAKRLAGANIPILGINLGSLGFLTGVSEDEMETALDALNDNLCRKSTRTVADCVTSTGKSFRMLNDAVIGFGRSSKITTLDLRVDEEPITSFACDGMVVCTPTGSTGHSLSAGGPILQPETAVFGINVICPHTLSNRPMIVPDSSTIEITIQAARKKLILSIDGQDMDELSAGDSLRITRSEQPVHFLFPPNYRYFSVLSQKLHWRGTSI